MEDGDKRALESKVVDGILAAHFRLPDPAALANTLIDYLHIACGGPYRIRLDGTGTGPDGSSTPIHTGVRVAGRKLVLEPLEPLMATEGTVGKNRAVQRIASIIGLLRRQQRPLWNDVEGQMEEALACHTEAPVVSPESVAQSCATQVRLLTRISERIRQSLAEYEQMGAPREVFLSGDPGRLRIVTVHRYFRDGVPFGRVVLAQSQIDALSGTRNSASPDAESPVPELVAPLAEFPMAIRQCFECGFALYGNWLDTGSAPAFVTAVKRVLGLKPGRPVPKACFIPCHVGGVAWTVSGVINPAIDPGFADLCLQLYREWIPRVFEALRTSAQADFLSSLLDSYQRGLAQSPPDMSGINGEWACIRRSYPLPRWELGAARPDHDDTQYLRLPQLRGQEWIIGRNGAANEYYRPSGRLSQPASWGSGSLWGETLLQRMSEITEHTSQAHDLQRLRAAQQAVGSWAHEVKSYTTPIISDLRSALRQTEASVPAYKPTRRALQAAVILNACSFGAQKILESRGAPSAETQMFLLPARGCEDIVEATLHFLLQYWRSASPAPLVLEWEPQLSERDAHKMLVTALGAREGSAHTVDDDETLLTHPAVIGVVSLLREVVFNIRCNNPIDKPLVRLLCRTSRKPHRLKLTLEQQQEERFAWSRNPDQPKGLERANRLYGPEGAQLGHIISHPPEQSPTRGGMSIKYVVEVEFNLVT